MMETKNNKNAGNNINNIIPIKWIGFIIFILSTCLAQAYEQETYLNLQDVIEDLNSGGHSELAEMFASVADKTRVELEKLGRQEIESVQPLSGVDEPL